MEFSSWRTRKTGISRSQRCLDDDRPNGNFTHLTSTDELILASHSPHHGALCRWFVSEEPPELVVVLAVWCVFVSFFDDSPGIVPVICEVNTFACGEGNCDENTSLDAQDHSFSPQLAVVVACLVNVYL